MQITKDICVAKSWGTGGTLELWIKRQGKAVFITLYSNDVLEVKGCKTNRYYTKEEWPKWLKEIL